MSSYLRLVQCLAVTTQGKEKERKEGRKGRRKGRKLGTNTKKDNVIFG